MLAAARARGQAAATPHERPRRAADTARRGEPAIVAYVNDGDTLRTTAGRKVRLVQIDAPELHGDCYGKAALAALRRLAPTGTRVTLVRDPALDATDRYGRLLRYVFVGRDERQRRARPRGRGVAVLLPRRARPLRARPARAPSTRRAPRGAATGAPARGARLDTAGSSGSITGPPR